MKIGEVKFPFTINDDSGYNGYSEQLTFYKEGKKYYADKLTFEHWRSGLRQRAGRRTIKILGGEVIKYYNWYLNESYRYKQGPFSQKFQQWKIKTAFDPDMEIEIRW